MEKIKQLVPMSVVLIAVILLIGAGWFIGTAIYGLNQKIDADTQAVNNIVQFINANIKK